MEDYYWDEIQQVMEEYNILHSLDNEEVEEGLDAFLGGDLNVE